MIEWGIMEKMILIKMLNKNYECHKMYRLCDKIKLYERKVLFNEIDFI